MADQFLLAMKIIYAIRGEEILVDNEDYEWLNSKRWHISSKGYATCSVKLPNGKFGVQRMHRMILGLEWGDPRQGDHRDNTKKLDNQRSNLRIATRVQNQANRGIPKRGKNPYKGVSETRTGRWIAQIRARNIHHFLGTFDTPEEAHEAYKQAAEELHGEFANWSGERTADSVTGSAR